MKCCCGDEHKYDPRWIIIKQLIAEHGETVIVKVVGQGSWNVPRAFIALHGFKGFDVGALADKYNWERVSE